MLQLYFPFNGDVKNYGMDTSITKLSIANPTFVAGVKEGTQGLNIDGYNASVISSSKILNCTEFTIAWWMKMDSSVTPTTTWSDIFSWSMKIDTTASGLCRIEQYRNTQGDFSFYALRNSGTYAQISNSASAKDVWTHFAIVKRHANWKFFINGVLNKTTTCADNSNAYISAGFKFGLGSNKTGAKLQDWRFYDTALADNGIPALMNALRNSCKQLDYHVNFYGGLSNNGIQRVASQTTTSLSYAVGKLGSSATFNGTSSKVVFDKPWMPTTGFTIAGWFVASNASTPQGAFAGCSTNNYGPVLHFSAGSHNLIVFFYYDTTNYEMAEVPLENLETLTRWHHYCGTWDGSKLKLYIDGELKAEQATTHQIYYPADHGNIGFGYRPGSGYFAGRMSEVRLYNYAISPVTVKELSLGRVGHYLLNGMETDSTLRYEYNTDRGTRGKGTINVTNSTIKLAGSPRYQSCYNLSSSGKYINLTNTYSTLNDQKTYNMWVYSTNYTSSWSSSSQCGLLSSVESGGDGWISNGSGNSRKLRAYSYNLGSVDLLATDLTAGWHMITHVQDGFKTSIYVDGVFYKSGTAKTSKTALSTKGNILFLAAECAGQKTNGYHWKGRVSDLEIFCTALSADDILARYKRGHIPTT